MDTANDIQRIRNIRNIRGVQRQEEKEGVNKKESVTMLDEVTDVLKVYLQR